MSSTAYSVYSHLSSISEAVFLCPQLEDGRAMTRDPFNLQLKVVYSEVTRVAVPLDCPHLRPCTGPCEIRKKRRSHVKTRCICHMPLFPLQTNSRIMLCIKWAATRFCLSLRAWTQIMSIQKRNRKNKCILSQIRLCLCMYAPQQRPVVT